MSVTLPASAAGILPSWTAAGFPCPGNLLVHDNRPGLDFPAYKKRRYKQRERKTVPFLQKLISLFEVRKTLPPPVPLLNSDALPFPALLAALSTQLCPAGAS